MTITAQVVADSISPADIRLVTLQLRYPKFVHGEVMTHRVFSRNASSSRAIPVARLIEDVVHDPVMPTSWGKNQAGMQAMTELAAHDARVARLAWLEARDHAVEHASYMQHLGVHKQLVNRIIEPWCHINVVVTSTEWANFFALRKHADAQPEIHALADAMHDAMQASTPTLLEPGQWHLPYVVQDNDIAFDAMLIKLSVARCARVSYLTHEGKKPNVSDELKRYDRLMSAEPMHASPAEHQATPDEWIEHGEGHFDLGKRWGRPEQHGNFVGWRQYRKMLDNECVKDR